MDKNGGWVGMSKLVECKACSKDVAKGVKKCPNCGKDQRNFFMRHKIFTGFLALILFFGVISTLGSDENLESSNNNEEIVETTEAEEIEIEIEDDIKEETDIKEEETQEDDVPREYKSALKKAEVYASSMDMSKAAVYDQLVSEHGEKFPEDAALYAMDNVEANWKENALRKAETYADQMAMSTDAIYDQLISEHGEKFTEEEAQYAIDNLD